MMCKSRSQKSAILRELLRYYDPFGEEIEMKIGYARVSTEEQNLEGQLELLQHAGCQRIFQEHASGVNCQRAALQQMLEDIRPGDTVVVWKLDRLARSTRDLLETVEQIQQVDATFLSVSEPWADTTSHVGKFIMTVFAGLAEFERELIRERTRVGRHTAQKRGVRFGRPPKLNTTQRALATRLLSEGQSAKQVAKAFGVHVSTIYRFVGTYSA
jgi:DNA invertase Pin-like site-specific DNA recombinase